MPFVRCQPVDLHARAAPLPTYRYAIFQGKGSPRQARVLASLRAAPASRGRLQRPGLEKVAALFIRRGGSNEQNNTTDTRE